MHNISLFRLYLMRAQYLLFSVGMGLIVWPGLIHHSKPWDLMTGVEQCMLGSFSALSLLGLRYPLQMLPLMLWELVWKVLWLGLIAYPAWAAGQMDHAMAETATEVIWVVTIPFVVPWPYVFDRYIRRPGNRWRRATEGTTYPPQAVCTTEERLQ